MTLRQLRTTQSVDAHTVEPDPSERLATGDFQDSFGFVTRVGVLAPG